MKKEKIFKFYTYYIYSLLVVCLVCTYSTVWAVSPKFQTIKHPQLTSSTSQDDSFVPLAKASSLEILQISTGSRHTCAITTDHELYCWGLNASGQLGIGDELFFSAIPRKVLNTTEFTNNNIISVSTGGYNEYGHTCAIRASSPSATTGTLFCWGANENGQLGINSTQTTFTPQQVQFSNGFNNNNIISVSTGGDVYGAHTCAIQGDSATSSVGKLFCWGNNYFGQLGNGNSGNNELTASPVVAGTEGFVNNNILDTSAGTGHTCAVRVNSNLDLSGTLFCWGNNKFGQLGNGASGDDIFSPTPIKVRAGLDGFSNTDVLSVSAGGGSNDGDHTCAIQANSSYSISGSLFCWGRNNNGQLGNNTKISQTTPTKVHFGLNGIENTNILSVKVGGYEFAGQSCAIKGDSASSITGTLFCWGDNSTAQLGDGTTTNQLTPTKVHTGKDGFNNTNIVSASTASGASSGTHSCAIMGASATSTSGTLHCWGNNYDGQLADKNSVSRTAIATKVQNGSDGFINKHIINLSSSGYTYGHTCAVVADSTSQTTGTLYCWGYNIDGQLGIGNDINQALPTKVLAGSSGFTNSNILSVSAGGNSDHEHTCAIVAKTANSNRGSVYCWGNNKFGQLGDDSTNSSSTPVKVASSNGFTNTNVIKISSGNNYTCAIETSSDSDTTGTLFCWGDNDYGQLGIDFSNQHPTPAKVIAGNDDFINSNIIDVSAGNGEYGEGHTCAIRNDYPNQTTGTLFCWGYNSSGQLGNGNKISTFIPSKVKSTTSFSNNNIISVVSGDRHTCAIKGDLNYSQTGSIYCWGNNTDGQLGINSTSNKSLAIKVNSVAGTFTNKDIFKLSSKGNVTCAIQNDATNTLSGKLFCWGNNSNGQLGLNNFKNQTLPTQVFNNSNLSLDGLIDDLQITDISCAGLHSCAVTTASELYCFGLNYDGRLGIGLENILYRKKVPQAVTVCNDSCCTDDLYTEALSGSVKCSRGSGLCKVDSGVLYCNTVTNSISCNSIPASAGELMCTEPASKEDNDCNGLADEEEDSDRDGVPNCKDGCPYDFRKTEAGFCGCGIIDRDTDGDGVLDCFEECPLNSQKTEAGICGCNELDTDTDNDGTPDCLDECLGDPNKIEIGICGCGVADIDTDKDGTYDCIDICLNDPNKIEPLTCGCGVIENIQDSDNDGTPDCLDMCPNNPQKTVVENKDTNCESSSKKDKDSDKDGVSDLEDACPNNQYKISLPFDDPTCGDPNNTNQDTDGDGVPDYLDGCVHNKFKSEIIAGEKCGSIDDLTDSDQDNKPDAEDECPYNRDKTEYGVCGCNELDTITSGSSDIPDCVDPNANTNKILTETTQLIRPYIQQAKKKKTIILLERFKDFVKDSTSLGKNKKSKDTTYYNAIIKKQKKNGKLEKIAKYKQKTNKIVQKNLKEGTYVVSHYNTLERNGKVQAKSKTVMTKFEVTK